MILGAKPRRKTAKLLFLWVFVSSVMTAGAVFSCPEPVYAESPTKTPVLNVPIPGFSFQNYPVTKRDRFISVPYLSAYIGALYKYIIGVTLVVAAVMITYGGFLYIVGATGAQISDAKEKITSALAGLMLVLAGYLILKTVNPQTVIMKPLQLETVSQQLESRIMFGDGVPMSEMETWEQATPETAPSSAPVPALPSPVPSPVAVQPTPSPAPEPGGPPQDATPALPDLFPGTDKPGVGKGCGASGRYKVGTRRCKSKEECLKLFCEQKDYSFDGGPDEKTLVGFRGIFPNTVGEQIKGKGVTFIQPPACYNPKGCDATKPTKTRPTAYLDIDLLGPKAKTTIKWMMDGELRFLPEVRDAIIKAGEVAKSKGYFITVYPGYRSMQGMAQTWCTRMQKEGGPQGLALPGTSPHQLGVAVDVALYKLTEDGLYKALTVLGGLCQQVEIQTQLGPENLKILEEIMSAAGFKHMCEEVWHFNYSGVYSIDCNECEFPGRAAARTASDSSCKKK